MIFLSYKAAELLKNDAEVSELFQKENKFKHFIAFDSRKVFPNFEPFWLVLVYF